MECLNFVALAILFGAVFVVTEVVVRIALKLTPPGPVMVFEMSFTDPVVAMRRITDRVAELGGAVQGNIEAGTFSVGHGRALVEGTYEMATLLSYRVSIDQKPARITAAMIEKTIRSYAECPPCVQPVSGAGPSALPPKE